MSNYNVDELIEKVNQAGQTIAGTIDLALFKQAVGMLFERLETVRPDEGKWSLSKVIPRKEFREFLGDLIKSGKLCSQGSVDLYPTGLWSSILPHQYVDEIIKMRVPLHSRYHPVPA